TPPKKRPRHHHGDGAYSYPHERRSHHSRPNPNPPRRPENRPRTRPHTPPYRLPRRGVLAGRPPHRQAGRAPRTRPATARRLHHRLRAGLDHHARHPRGPGLAALAAPQLIHVDTHTVSERT